MKRMRLDKYLADCGIGTRSSLREMIRRGRVKVNEKIIKEPAFPLNAKDAAVFVDNIKMDYKEFYYLIMNKPAGVISATEDTKQNTVLDLLPDRYKRLGLFPVGRLDKDTEGLLILTNDGPLTHRLLSPKKHVPKTYFARIDECVTEEDVQTFKDGIYIDDDFTALPAQLQILQAHQQSEILLTLYEGKFHQVKRMFEAINKKVVYLKRVRMGNLELDESLQTGQVREMSEKEIQKLQAPTEKGEI